MNNKIKRINGRKNRLEKLAQEERAICLKHKKYLCLRDVQQHHCYSGNHGKSYCKYLEIER